MVFLHDTLHDSSLYRLNPLYEDPLATIAVIQGGVAGHHNVIHTATDPQQASSTSSIGQQPNEVRIVDCIGY